jgi:PadR family transcriptional regulator, regulatory protein AphA
MSTPRLSHTSYLVLGLVEGLGGATPYELKQIVNESIGCFWSFPHSQLYSEPERLVGLGMLDVDQEDAGRRRKRYTITGAGREALQAWLRNPAAERSEIREPGVLKLFFGELADAADMTRLAQAQIARYEQELERYAAIEKTIMDKPEMRYPHATLRLGIAAAQACLTFWTEVAEGRLPG